MHKNTGFLTTTIILLAAFMVSTTQYSTAADTLSPKENAAIKEARDIRSTVIAKIKTTLNTLLVEGDMLKAISVCAITAPELMDEYNRKPAYTVKRISNKYRNPKNMPDYYEKTILDEMEKLLKEGRLDVEYEHTRTVVESDGIEYMRYMKPIMVERPCLKCHGASNEISQDVRKFLKRFYPGDKATGFKEGDLRGAFSIKIPMKFPPK